jgi:CDGSH-type Zn-finger protein
MTAPVTITVRKNGSLLVTGEVTLLDHLGNTIPRINDKANIALCRCGHSQRKPFCDGAHKACGFEDPIEPAAPAGPAAP